MSWQASTKEMNRIKDLPTAFQRLWDAQKKIRSGEASGQLPENPTEEQLTAWREKNGIPAEADAYDLGLGDMELSERDTALMGDIKAAAHELGVNQQQLAGIVGKYFESQQAVVLEREALDQQALRDGEITLKKLWGADTERNKNIFNAMTAQLPQELNDMIHSASGTRWQGTGAQSGLCELPA